LLVHANHVLSRDRLIDELWGEHPPETAVQSLQVYVSRLRKLLPSDTLLTRAPVVRESIRSLALAGNSARVSPSRSPEAALARGWPKTGRPFGRPVANLVDKCTLRWQSASQRHEDVRATCSMTARSDARALGRHRMRRWAARIHVVRTWPVAPDRRLIRT